MKNKKNWFRLAFVIMVFAGIYITFKDSAADIWNEIKNIQLSTILILCACSVAFNCFEGINLSMFCKKYNPKFGINQGIGCSYYSSFFRTVTLGSASFAAGMYYMDKRQVPLSKNFGLITVNYILQKLTLTFYGVIFVMCNQSFCRTYYSGYSGYILAGIGLTLVVAVVLLSVCVSKILHKWIFIIARKLVRKQEWLTKLDKYELSLLDIRTETWSLLRDKKLLVNVILFNVLKYSSWFLISVVVLYNTTGISIPVIMGVTALSLSLAGVIPTPAGIGSTEFMYVLLFTPLVGGVMAASSMLVFRFATFVVPFLIGAVMYMVMKIKKCH